ncbi:MAG: hypothetical protein GC153_06590 [Alphaproteobacteria bacterium]|nr:hypothetical protein [Alphaproteobacteria bacterium]
MDADPFAIVRRPIYTGLLTGAFALAAIKGTALAAFGFALIVLGFWMKARLEEKLLTHSLGEEYAAYRARTPMLLPWPRPKRR